MQIGVCSSRDAVQIGTLPVEAELRPDTECRRDRAQCVDANSPKASSLEPTDGFTPDPSAAGDVGLSEALADADDTECVSEAYVVHGGSVEPAVRCPLGRESTSRWPGVRHR